ncbi:zinc-binding oxidoreductase-like protein ToxD [Xylariales sp. PMI_506]|nr:zinc-binding oxidoreductase-like protein ToxD [Xylariales sp. PMI_506]
MPKQAIVQSSLEAVHIIETPIPVPNSQEVTIKVVVSGTNPKDWKYPLWNDHSHNSGDDIAGIVHSVGENVYEFKPGDRVAAFHEVGKENGSFAEYAVAPCWTTFHIPPTVSFEEAATLPVAALTAAVALYSDMKFPWPLDSINKSNSSGDGHERVPLLIYGVTSAVGAFAAKLARLSGLGPIIGVAGRSRNYASRLCDHVADYRMGEDALVAAIEDILTREGLGVKVTNVFDAISEGGSIELALRFLDLDGGIVCTALPPKVFAKDKENFRYPAGVRAYHTVVAQVHSTLKDIGYLWSRFLGRLLEDGRLDAHPYEVIPGGLDGVLTGLQKLRDGKASAVKYVYRIEETENVKNSYSADGKTI